MAYLSAVVGVQDSSGTRVDSPDALGTYLPIVLKIGANITPAAAQVGGVSVVTLTGAAGVASVTGAAPIASSGGATPSISISAASALGSGSMSVAHWTLLDGATDAATASTLVKRDASSVTKLSALATGATPATTGQVRLTDSTIAIRASIVGISGQNDRTVIGTIGEDVTLGSGFGSAYAQILDGGTEGFYVSDPTIVGPSGTYLSVTSAAAALTVPLAMGSNKITGLADGVAASDAATVGQLGGGAPSRIVTPNAGALLWALDEAAGPYVQTGKLVSLNLTASATARSGHIAPLGRGVSLPTNADALLSDSTAEGETADTTIHWWRRGHRAPQSYWGPLKRGASDWTIGATMNGPTVPQLYYNVGAGPEVVSVDDPDSRLRRSLQDDSWHHYAVRFLSVSNVLSLVLDGTVVYTSSALAAGLSWTGSGSWYVIEGTYSRLTVEPVHCSDAVLEEVYRRGVGWYP